MSKHAFILLVAFLISAAGAAAQPVADAYFAAEVGRGKPDASADAPTPSSATAPANDDFADAAPIVLGPNGNILLTTSSAGASKETGEPDHADNAGGHSVWFNFTPTATKAVEIRTVSNETNFDTTLAVYKGNTLASLVPVGANDDCFRQECGTRSRVRLLLAAGTTYRIAVDGYFNGTTAASGTFKLIMEEYDAGFEFDNLAGAYDLGAARAGTIGMTNHLATAQAGEPTHYNNTPAAKSVWFRFRTDAYRAMTFELRDDFAGELAVYESPVENPTFAQLTKIDTNADTVGLNYGRYAVTFWAAVNTHYFIAVAHNADNSNQPATGNFRLKFYQTKLRYSMRLDQFTDHAALSIFRPAEATWYSQPEVSPFPSPKYVKFGLAGDVPVPADYDGDAVTDYAVARNSGGLKHWYIAGDAPYTSYSHLQWGLATDKAVVGDFNRDGRADPAVVRNVGGQLIWYVAQSLEGFRCFVFGLAGDKPVLGDFDGDGATDVAVVRATPDGLVWYILRSNFNESYAQTTILPFGSSGDVAAVEDYDGDGKTDVAVFRPSNGTWYVLRSRTGELQATPFGSAGDRPQPADYDNDGKSELAVFRPSEGKWYFWFSASDTQAIRPWGLASDVAISSLATLSQ